MKTFTLLIGTSLCLAVVAPARAEPNPDHDHHRAMRHRPKRQFPSDYGYHTQWPRLYEPRRDDGLQDLRSQVNRLIEEVSQLRRSPPPPPPQLVYVPYPIQYPIQSPVLPRVRYCKCQEPNLTPNITIRFPEMDDKNQNWGYDLSQETPENYAENTRPINFDRSPPPEIASRAPPRVEHGTDQADSEGKSPREGSVRSPRRCDAMVLSCCDPKRSRQEQHKCFTIANCVDYFEKNDVCSQANIQNVLDLFASKYSPL